MTEPKREEICEQGKDGVYRRKRYKTVDAIGWRDEEVIDDSHCTKNTEDGTMSFAVHQNHLADGSKCSNALELIIKVEVVASETAARSCCASPPTKRQKGKAAL